MSSVRRKTKRTIQRKVKPVRPSKTVETNYRIRVRKHIQRIYEPLFASQNWISITPERIDRLKRKVTKRINDSLKDGGSATKAVKAMVRDGNQYNKRSNRALWSDAVGVSFAKIMDREGITEIMQAKVRENVSLIRSVSSEMLERTEDVLWRQLNGQTTETLNAALSSIYGNANNRATIIARDQTSKFNAALNRQRNENLSVTKYIWRTSNDERVRDSHEANNGQTFEYDEPPPSTGNPGDDVLCRCTAEPDVGAVLDRLGL